MAATDVLQAHGPQLTQRQHQGTHGETDRKAQCKHANTVNTYPVGG